MNIKGVRRPRRKPDRDFTRRLHGVKPEALATFLDRLALDQCRARGQASPGDYLPPGAEVFTPRERETVKLLAEGCSNKIIADRLDISEHTAKFHTANVMRKLHADNRAAAAVAAVRMGLA